MGFFSFIGSAISTVGSAISSGISKLGSAICTGIGAAGKMLAGLATTAGGFLGKLAASASGFLGKMCSVILGPVLGPIIGPILIELAIQFLVKVISGTAQKEGVVDEDERPEDIGYRMQEAENHKGEWKQREEFASLKEYTDYLKKQIPEVDENYIKANHLSCQLLGMQAESELLSEKYRIGLSQNFLEMAARTALESDELRAFVDAYKKLGYKTLDVEAFFTGRLSGREADAIRDALLSALGVYYPEKTQMERIMRLNEIANAATDDYAFAKQYAEQLKTGEVGAELQRLRAEGHMKGKDTVLMDKLNLQEKQV